MFQHEFENAVARYNRAAPHLFSEVRVAYTNRGRHYHTLVHLDHLVEELKPYQQQFTSWDTIVFSIAYHDFVYKVTRTDNEEKSAAVAEARLKEMDFPIVETERVVNFIRATKKHESVDYEVDLFTDADLAILGAATDRYQHYTAEIRKEYSIYPDLLYKPGRKKVLQRFLKMNRIYKTDEFYNRYEQFARRNLEFELERLA